ncbi:MAG: winged helix-turn-helix transcriptional regulator [Thermoplasmata archaeon]
MFDLGKILSGKRWEIMEILREEKRPSELSSILKITRQGVDKHLSILEKYLLIKKSKKGGKVFYVLSDNGKFLMNKIMEINSKYIDKIKNDYYFEKNSIENLFKNGKLEKNEFEEKLNNLILKYSIFFGKI